MPLVLSSACFPFIFLPLPDFLSRLLHPRQQIPALLGDPQTFPSRPWDRIFPSSRISLINLYQEMNRGHPCKVPNQPQPDSLNTKDLYSEALLWGSPRLSSNLAAESYFRWLYLPYSTSNHQQIVTISEDRDEAWPVNRAWSTKWAAVSPLQTSTETVTPLSLTRSVC